MSVIAGLAPAKINLSLRVVSHRPDGFHDIVSVVAFLDLCDSLLFSPTTRNQELHISGRSGSVPADHRNLVLRAAEALSRHVGQDLPFSAILDKRIPAGAGLGGGSSDAATALLVLNELYDLNVSTAELARIGSTIGSDVPMFLTSGHGSCRMTGRGEIVEPLDWEPAGHCVLLLPKVHCPTPAVYAAWDHRPCSSAAGRGLPCEAPPSAESWLSHCFNDLQSAAFELFPPLEQIQQQAEAICGRPVVLTGSGSALFTAFDDAGLASQMAARLSDEVDIETLVVRFRTGAGNKLPEVQHADY